MAKYAEVRLAGFGGQGIILAGILLAEAAGVYDNHFAVQTQSYGPEARGGTSRADVIISDSPIDYPKTRKLDIFLGLTQEALDLYIGDLSPEGMVIADSSLVQRLPEDERLVPLPLTSMTLERLGRTVVTNVVSLSAIQALTEVVTLESLRKAIEQRVPPRLQDINVMAIELGQELAAEHS
jgi:2-oxoglutarate ferredoxin oxidoreductase subunit gamma